jgi:hypothetical protein
MPNLHIIIGDTNTRKSSLLRCLTSVGGGSSNKDMSVSLVNNNIIVVHCVMSALQELYNPRTPAEFIAYVQALEPAPTDIAFALHVSAHGNYPDVLTYIQEFTQAGWQVSNVALLGALACSLQGLPGAAKVARVPNSPNRPTNESASGVRQVWGWR